MRARVPHRHRLVAAIAASVTLSLLVADRSFADRPSTPQEHQQLADAVGLPADCVQTWISTEDPAWAVMYMVYDEDNCPVADGVVLWELTGGVWTQRYAGPADSQPCPISDQVPDEVAQDFGLCYALSRKVYTVNWAAEKLVVKPRRLPQGAHGVYENLRWKRWGKRKATGRGYLFYDDAYDTFRVPVRITLSRIGVCDTDRRTYKRMSMKPVSKRDRQLLRHIDGAFPMTCPR